MISVTLNIHEARKHDACEEGIEYLRGLLRMAGEAEAGQIVIVRWTLLHSLWLARDCEFAEWARNVGMIPQISGAGADLAGADLAGADLAGADLAGADLADANLADANLADANLADANLAGAYLADAYLDVWERGPDGYARRKDGAR